MKKIKKFKRQIMTFAILASAQFIQSDIYAFGYKPKTPGNFNASSISSGIEKFYNQWILALIVAAGVIGLALPFFKMIISANSQSKRVEAKEAIGSVVLAVIGVVAAPKILIYILQVIGA